MRAIAKKIRRSSHFIAPHYCIRIARNRDSLCSLLRRYGSGRGTDAAPIKEILDEASPIEDWRLLMSAYMIAQINVHDAEEYQKYLAGFLPIFERYGGELLVTSRSETEVIEGEWAYPRTVIMKFPSLEQARRWHDDPDYQALAEHRRRSAQANLVLVEGVS